MAVTIASTHYVYPESVGQAELAWLALLSTKMVYPQIATHLSNNLARRRATSLMPSAANDITIESNWPRGNTEVFQNYHTVNAVDDLCYHHQSIGNFALEWSE